MTDNQNSEYYTKYMQDSSNRLDYVFYHPRYDEIKTKIKSKNFRDLGSLLIPDSIHQGYGAIGEDIGITPYINIENLDYSGKINSTDISHIDNAPKNRLLELNDILFSRSREVGISCIITSKEVNHVCGSYIFFFKIKQDDVLPLFLVKYLNSELAQSQIEYIQTGSSGNNINMKEVKTIKILCPPSIIEQQKIVTVYRFEVTLLRYSKE